MRILINAINAISPGVLQTTKNLINNLPIVDSTHRYLILLPQLPEYRFERIHKNPNIQIKYLRPFLSKKIWYLFFNHVHIKTISRNFCANAIISLANLSPSKFRIPSIVIIRNFFYVDPTEISKLSFFKKLAKKVELLEFALTARNTDRFIVQNTYVKKKLASVWHISDNKIDVCPNPLAEDFENRNNLLLKDASDILPGKFKLIYVSRYYPYKNHILISKIAEYLKFKNIEDIVFLITINKNTKETKKILQKIKYKELEKIIVNIGEVDHSELSKWYHISDALFYPSLLETFGNPLIEAMSFGLPICVIDRPYSRAICKDSALYFDNSVSSALRTILLLKNNPDIRNELSKKSKKRILEFPTWEQTIKKYLSILESLV